MKLKKGAGISVDNVDKINVRKEIADLKLKCKCGANAIDFFNKKLLCKNCWNKNKKEKLKNG
jgi:hypothetical protein